MLINYKGQAAGGGLQTVSSGRVDSSVEVISNVSRREGLEVLVVLKSHKSITSPCTACSAAGVPIVPVPERVAHAAPCPAAPGGCAAGGHAEHPRAATPAPCSPPRGPRWRAARRCGPPGGGRWWWRSPSAGGPGGLPRGGAALARSPSAPAAPAPRGPRRQWLLLPADISTARSSQRRSPGESACGCKRVALNFPNFTAPGARSQFHSKCHEGRAELFAVPVYFLFFCRIRDSGNSEN